MREIAALIGYALFDACHGWRAFEEVAIKWFN